MEKVINEIPIPAEPVDSAPKKKKAPNPTGRNVPDESTYRLQQTVLQYRRDGLTFPEIADRLERTQGYIYKVYKKALKNIIVDNVADVRRVELERLDQLQAIVSIALHSFTPLINQGRVVKDYLEDGNGNLVKDEHGEPILVKIQDYDAKMKAVNAALKIMERRARLLGLDAPTKIEATGEIKTVNVHATLTLEQAREEAQRRGLPLTVFQT